MHTFHLIYHLTGNGTNVLIDSGLAKGVQLPPGLPAPIVGNTVIEQILLLELHPSEIDLLICTHFDLDHAGHHAAFTNAELLVQRQHYEVEGTVYACVV